MTEKIRSFVTRLWVNPVFRGIFALSALIVLQRLMALWPKAITVAFLGLVVTSLFLRLRRELIEHKHAWVRNVVVSARKIRMTLGAAPSVRSIYLTAMFFGVILLGYGVLFGATGLFGGLTYVIAVSFALAGGLDTARLMVRMTRFVWARTIGKIVLGAITAGSVWLSTRLAEHAVATATALDPKNFETSTTALAALITPALFVAIAAALFAIIALATLVLMFTGYFCYKYGETAAVALALGRPRSSKASWAKRIVFGSRAASRDHGGWFPWDSLILQLRPVSIFAVSIWLAAGSGTFVLNGSFENTHLVAEVVARMDFYAASKCANMDTSKRTHYGSGKEVIFASPGPTGWTFAAGECQ